MYLSQSTAHRPGAISCFDGGCITSSSKKFNASVDRLGLMTVASSGASLCKSLASQSVRLETGCVGAPVNRLTDREN